MLDVKPDPRTIARRGGRPFMKGGFTLHSGGVLSPKTEIMALPFSRNPTGYTSSLKFNTPHALIPGASDVSLQHLGGKGETFSLEVLFYNAWISREEIPADAALQWFRDLLMSSPKYRVVWYPGSDKNMIPVAILGVDIEARDFVGPTFPSNHPDLPVFAGGTPGPDAPQHVKAQIRMRRETPSLKLASPFKTEPKKSRRHRGKPLHAARGNSTQGGTIGGAINSTMQAIGSTFNSVLGNAPMEDPGITLAALNTQEENLRAQVSVLADVIVTNSDLTQPERDGITRRWDELGVDLVLTERAADYFSDRTAEGEVISDIGLEALTGHEFLRLGTDPNHAPATTVASPGALSPGLKGSAVSKQGSAP